MDTSTHRLNQRGTRSHAARMIDDSLSNERTPFLNLIGFYRKQQSL